LEPPVPRAVEPTPQTFWSNGLRLVGESWGDPHSPTVVLLHGGGQTRHAWRNAGRHLAAAGYHVIAYDSRGHGDSDWDPQGDYSKDAMVEDLVYVVEAVPCVRPALVGASMGGDTALIAVGEGHVDAAAVVLVDVAPHVERAGVDGIQTFMHQHQSGFASLDEVADAIAVYQPHRARTRRVEGLAKNVRLRDDGRYYWHWDPRHVEREPDLEARRARLEASLSSLQLPTLLVRGALSDLLSDDSVAKLLAILPSAVYVNVTGAAHMAAGDRNDDFIAAVAEFLERVHRVESSA
jgi:non-heme chloroperoxidase